MHPRLPLYIVAALVLVLGLNIYLRFESHPEQWIQVATSFLEVALFLFTIRQAERRGD